MKKASRFVRVTGATLAALMISCCMFLVGCVTRTRAVDPIKPILHGDPGPPIARHGDMVVYPPPKLLFNENKANLTPEAKAALDALCTHLRDHPKDTVVVEGHAAETGNAEFNVELSAHRAEAAKKYLVEHGIDQARISTKSYGDTKPAVPSDSPANTKLNRFVTFEITCGNN